MTNCKTVLPLFGVLALFLTVATGNAYAQSVEPVLSLAKKERPALLETLKDLVSIAIKEMIMHLRGLLSLRSRQVNKIHRPSFVL